MNRAWIPAGALASVSVAGLIALGPLTDSLNTPVSFHGGVVTVSAPAPKSTAVAVSFPAAIVGKTQTTNAALARGGASKQLNSDIGQVAVKISHNPPAVQTPAAPPKSTSAPPVKKKTNKRPTSIGGSTGSNGDVGLASGGKSAGSSVGEQSSQLPSDSNP